jgi:hypothetical protein
MTKHLQTWINHVKQWASQHNCKYGEALKNSECRNNYKNKGSSTSNNETVSEAKPKRKYVRKANKVEAPTELPKEVLNVIQKRKYTRKTPQIPSPI